MAWTGLGSPAHANLGETVQQLVVRYGKPTGYAEANAKMPFGSLEYKAAGYLLIIYLLDSKEVGARISRLDKSDIASADLQNIMAAETNGAPWTPAPSDDPSSLQWSRVDGATFLYDKDKRILILTSPEMATGLHAAPNPKPITPAPPATAAP